MSVGFGEAIYRGSLVRPALSRICSSKPCNYRASVSDLVYAMRWFIRAFSVVRLLLSSHRLAEPAGLDVRPPPFLLMPPE